MDCRDLKKVALIGSGTMGPGIAQTFARAGLEVFLVDLHDRVLERGMKQVRANLDLFIELGIIPPQEKDPILARIHPTTDMENACRQADYFMEAVQEILEMKQKVFRQADEWCPSHALLTTNASSMKIDPIATVTRRPERVVGTHWVNPPHIMPLVEVVRGETASDETVETVRQFLTGIGKAPIVCRDTLSYLNNAMQSVLWRKALELFQEGVAPAEDIDQAVMTGFGSRLPIVGPLAFLDLAGLDNIRDAWEYKNRVTNGAFGPVPSLLQDLIAKGHLGLKTGKGFYDYGGEKAESISLKRNRPLILMLKALGRI
jgi:3-hydroxybutyryl-CoA dehydrogenase